MRLSIHEIIENIDQETLRGDSFLDTVKQMVLADEDFVNSLYSKVSEAVAQEITERLASGDLSHEINMMYRQSNQLLESEIRQALNSNCIKPFLNVVYDESSAKRLYGLFEQSALNNVSPKLDRIISEKLQSRISDIGFQKEMFAALNKSNSLFIDAYTDIIAHTLESDYSNLENRVEDELNRFGKEIQKIKHQVYRNYGFAGNPSAEFDTSFSFPEDPGHLQSQINRLEEHLWRIEYLLKQSGIDTDVS
ncbi:hypothetical protein [Faecalibaculum rodentium]|uniref:hypothetical protein n=2 Tax=Faecalibaculum rodentium TaxID=1702221 RepID=UPI0025AE11D1|nr:hypothetical protein [Faecalibaculum rodentium]